MVDADVELVGFCSVAAAGPVADKSAPGAGVPVCAMHTVRAANNGAMPQRRVLKRVDI
jgi:hypothetical protein